MATLPRRKRARIDRIGLGSSGVRMSPDDFDARPSEQWDERFRHELIEGVLVVSPPPSIEERDPNDELGHMLRSHRESHALGSRLDATAPEQTIPMGNQRRRADRAIWAGLGRTPDPARDMPTIVVEFVSRSRRDFLRDYEQKRDEYLNAGVREYWVIDRFRRILTVYRQGTLGPTHEIVTETQAYATDLLPGFELPLARLLSRADRWKTTRPRPSIEPPAGGTHG